MTKKIIVKVQSGMCNRLIPFVTGLRLSDLLKSEFFLYWDDNCRDTAYNYKGEKTLYKDMFEKIENVNYIEKNEFDKLINSSKNILKINYCETKKMLNYTLKDLEIYNTILFNDYVHLIYTKEDNISILTYSNLDYLKNKEYSNKLFSYFNKLKPVNKLQQLINEVKKELPEKNNLIGIHLRHWPVNPVNHPQQVSQQKNKEFYDCRIKLMNQEIEKNNKVRFFISTTDKKELNNLIHLFPNRIIYFKNRLGNNEDDKYYLPTKNSNCNKFKNLNGVIDLFLLSECPIIYIEKNSSYSVCAKYIGNSRIQEIEFDGKIIDRKN